MTDLHELLPAALRGLDEAQGGPLRDLLDLLGVPLAHLDEDLAQLHDDLFIETCAEWVVPYIGELVGHRPLRGPTSRLTSPRAEVARTIGYRRRKGTAAVLEQIARDITGRPARVVEAWQHLALTQHLLHLRPHVRHGLELRRPRDHAGPFATAAHTVDLRAHRPYNLPDITVFLWRLRALPLARVTPFALDRQRLVFSPLGDRVPLFHRPDPAHTGPVVAPAHVPAAISRRRLHDDPATYYGEGKSLVVHIDGAPVPLARVDAADLADDPADPSRWSRLARPGRIAIDPERGRLAVAADLLAPTSAIDVSFHVGAADELGGGQYERHLEGTADRVTDDPRDLAAHVAAMHGRGTLELRTSRTAPLAPQTLAVAAGQRLVVRAAARERPLLTTVGPLVLTGGEGSELVLDGLVLAGPLEVPADTGLRRLTFRHCTLVPGLSRTQDGRPAHPAAPSLRVLAPGLRLSFESCISGPVEVTPSAALACTRCVLDAGAASRPALGGGAVGLDRCTVIGSVRAESIDLVTNSLLLGPVVSVRRQTGCVRNSYVAPGSQTPRRHACLPGDGDDPLLLAPRFHALRYGHPHYALLRPDAPARLREAADDEAEPGVFHDLLLPLVEANLRTRLEEHLRLGLAADLAFVT